MKHMEMSRRELSFWVLLMPIWLPLVAICFLCTFLANALSLGISDK
jgi:hypothetical protein